MAKKPRAIFSFPPGPPYTAADLAEIARTLGIAECLPHHVRVLQDAAESYRLAEWIQSCGIPSRAEIRASLLRIADAAKTGASEITDAWTDLSYLALKLLQDEHAPEFLDVCESRQDLREAAIQAAAEVRCGAEPKDARFEFVSLLYALYFMIKRKAPTRRTHQASCPGAEGGTQSQAYGPFLSFVRACIHPIDPALCIGIEATIAKVLREHRDTLRFSIV